MFIATNVKGHTISVAGPISETVSLPSGEAEAQEGMCYVATYVVMSPIYESCLLTWACAM